MNKLPVYYFNNYATNTEKVVSQVQNQAKVMIKAYKNHHLYKHNQFQEWLLNNIATVINQIEMSINFLNDVSVSCIVVSTTHSYKSRVLALVAAKKEYLLFVCSTELFRVNLVIYPKLPQLMLYTGTLKETGLKNRLTW